MRETEWIPVTERLPEKCQEVLITWKNMNPAPYYEDIKGIPISGAAVFYEGKWYWYSSTTQDILAEYGECEGEKIEVDVTAWMPFPEPYKGR